MAPIDDTPTGMPPMIGKCLSIAEWSEYARSYQWGALKPSRLVLHHTYIPNEQQWRGLTSMRGMQRFYAGKGWTAAPHMYCGPDGIWLFTPMRDVGIHAGTGNGSIKQGWYSIGCEMVGYFDHVKPQGAVWENARAVMGILASVLDIPPRTLISFHRDYTNTKTCPGSAVQKEWVFGEVEAWMAANIKAPPVRPDPQPARPAPQPVPQPPQPTIPPHAADLVEQLLHETYRHRSQGYNSAWAFHQWAAQHDLGAPLGRSKQAKFAGATWNYEVFGRDVLFCEVPHWGDVHSLVRDLAQTPSAPHLLALRDMVFHDAGLTFKATDPLHAAAALFGAGPPLGQREVLTAGGRRYRALVCAADTLYFEQGQNRVGKYSELAAGNAATQPLRTALAALAYTICRVPYKADSAFVRTAEQARLGVPLSDVYPVRGAAGSFMVQVFALDTLLAGDVSGSNMRRLSELQRGMAAPAQAKSVAGAPCPDWYGPTRWLPSAGRGIQRQPAEINQITLVLARRRGDGGLQVLDDGGALHFLVTLQGEVIQLLDECNAPESQDDDRSFDTALLVGIESPTVIEPGSARPQVQIDVVARLLAELRARFGISQERVRFQRSARQADLPQTIEHAGRV